MEYTLEKLEVYNLAEKFSHDIWKIVMECDYFKKDTIGKQLVSAADSIPANIAEGDGRYFYKESKLFYFYSRGSIPEAKSRLSKCLRRKIFETQTREQLLENCKKLLLMLNAFIKFIRDCQQTIKPIY